MGLYLVTGQPGHGKTAYALDKAFGFKKEGRKVYAHGVKDLDYDKAGFTYLDDPAKWQELPDGAVVLLDECYTVFPNRNPGAKVPDHVEAMARHRHRGFDFILVAQQGLQLDPFLRGLYEDHVHVRQTSVFKAKTKLKRWTQYQNNTQVACNDVVDWIRPKYVFDYYTSTTMVTTKRSMPMWLRWLLVAFGILLVLLLGIKWWFDSKIAQYSAETTPAANVADGGVAPRGGAATAAADEPATPYEYAKAHLPRFGTMPWTAQVFDGRAPVAQPELYCMSSMPAPDDPRPASCTCVTEQGTRYTLSQPECRTVARHGTPYNPYRQPAVVQAVAPAAVEPILPIGNLAGSVVAGAATDVVGAGIRMTGSKAQVSNWPR